MCRFQDGAATANNPAALALAEARLLWPGTPIEALVSLGSGVVPVQRREKSMSAYLDIGSVLIEARPLFIHPQKHMTLTAVSYLYS